MMQAVMRQKRSPRQNRRPSGKKSRIWKPWVMADPRELLVSRKGVPETPRDDRKAA